MKRFAIVTCAALGCSTTGSSPAGAPAPRASAALVWADEEPLWTTRPTSSEISANDLRSRLYPLAHDSMRGRRAGERGNHVATEYIAREFQRLGLTAAGDNGTYFQDLPYGPLGYDQSTLTLRVGDRSLALRSEWVPLGPGATFAGSVNAANVPVVYGGRWGDSVAWDAATVRGKFVVLQGAPGAPGVVTPQRPPLLARCDSVPDRFGAAAAIANANAQTVAPQQQLQPSNARRDTRAQEAGALGVFIVGLDDLSPQAAAAATAPRMAMQPNTPPNNTGPVAALISKSAATALMGRPIDDVAVGATGGRVSMTANYGWSKSTTPARNVIAMLKGSDPARAGEYVLVGAHNDHVGTIGTPVDHDSVRAVNYVTRRQGANDPVCRPTAEQQRRIDSLIARARSIRPVRRDSVMNGADDDGSGTVVMLEIAEKFASERPARSIVFISHQGEEVGLLGSRWFVDHPTVPLANVVAAHNMDMLGKGRVEYVKYGGPNSVQMLGSRRLSREFGDIIDSVNAVRTEPMAIDKSWDVPANPLNRFCRSDQVSYVRKDIPVTYFSLGYSVDYHQATDEPQYIDYEHSARLGRFIHDVMWAISERKTRPSIVGPDPAYPRC